MTLAEIVADALEHGSLLGRGSYGKTLTIDGRRYVTIRVQLDIFGALYGPDAITPYYPALRPAIAESIASIRGELADARASSGVPA